MRWQATAARASDAALRFATELPRAVRDAREGGAWRKTTATGCGISSTDPRRTPRTDV
jgi:hypothetical protein